MSVTAARVRVRGALFVVLAAALLLLPALPQVFGVERPYLRDWAMYREVGLDVVVASFAARGPDGELRPLDRFTALGRDRRLAPLKLWRIDGEGGLMLLGRELCAALGPGADLRAHARIASRSGWTELHAGEHNLCERQPPRPARPRGGT